jgi:hypothetical protein
VNTRSRGVGHSARGNRVPVAKGHADPVWKLRLTTKPQRGQPHRECARAKLASRLTLNDAAQGGNRQVKMLATPAWAARKR